MQVNITDNIDEVLQKLQQLEQHGKNLTPVFGSIANLLLNAAEHSFETETSAVTGQEWQALADSTLKQKAKQGKGNRQKLESSLQLRDTLAVFSDNNSAVIGVNAISEQGYNYPAVHQYGTNDGKIVAREFLPFDANGDITDELKSGMLDIVAEHFEQS